MDKKILKCAQCARSFGNVAGLLSHLQSHNLRNYGCAQCSQTFLQIRFLRFHLNAVHNGKDKVNGERPFQCDVCGNNFRTFANVLTHKIIHQPRQFKCSKCDVDFRRHIDLDRHQLMIHQVTTQKELDCKVCGKHFPSRNSLTQHSKFHLAPQLSCSKCDAKFFFGTQLWYHLKNYHYAEWISSYNHVSYKCAICCRPFNLVGHLMRHLNGHYTKERIRNNNEKPLNYQKDKLRLGGKTLFKPNSLHIEDESTISACPNVKREFICAKCGQSFARKCRLFSHLPVHQIPEISCPACPTKFGKLIYLQTHLRKIHSFTEQQSQPKCDICGKKFQHSGLLRLHMLCCHDVAKIICEHCGIKVFTPYTLTRHIQSAHSNKWKMPNPSKVNCRRTNYICSICCVPFGNRKHRLLRHLRLHHR